MHKNAKTIGIQYTFKRGVNKNSAKVKFLKKYII